jgi:hypothetical protein
MGTPALTESAAPTQQEAVVGNLPHIGKCYEPPVIKILKC